MSIKQDIPQQKPSHSLLMLIFANGLSYGFCAPLFAQESTELERVLVTASPVSPYLRQQIDVAGKAQTWQEIPESVSVITQKQMNDRQLSTVDEALDKVTGIRTKSNDNLVKSYFARGYSMSALYDGIGSYNNMGGHGNFDLPIYEAVEVIRGPSGIFRGVGEPGGVVNFVKKRPQSRFSSQLNIELGSWQKYIANIDIGGSLNPQKSLRARAVLGHQRQHFFYDFTRSKTTLGMLALEWDITSQTTANLSYSAQNKDVYGTNFGLPTYQKNDDGIWPLMDVPRHTNLSADWVKDAFHLREWSAWIKYRFNEDGEIKLSLNHRDQRQYFNEVFPYSSVNPENMLVDFSSLKGDARTQRTGVDIYALVPFSLWKQKHRWLIGANYDFVRNRNQRGWGPDFSQVPFDQPTAIQTDPNIQTNSGRQSHTKQYGLYSQLKIHPIQSLSIILGGRYSGFNEKSRSVQPSAKLSDWQEGKTTHAHFTPYSALVYQPHPSWSVYLSHTGIFVPQTQEKWDGSTLQPREGRQIEMGVKKQWNNGKFNTSLAYFNLRDRNRAYLDQNNSNPQARRYYYLNAGEIESAGWEMELSGSPYPGWNVALGYTYLKTRYLKDSDKKREQNTFDFYTPRHMLKLYGQYRFGAHHFLHGLSVGLGLRAQSKTPARTNQRPLLINSGYAVWDMNAQYQFNRQTNIGLSIKNLTDKKYYSHVSGAYMGNFYGEPRSFALRLQVRFH